MHIVMPMAGHGSRFKQAGYTDPKPLIPVFGRPMYTWAMDSLPLSMASKIIFICLQEHLDDLRLREDIMTRYSEYNPIIIGLDEVTAGQSCTVLKARELINNSEALLIYNADTFCDSKFAEGLEKLKEKGINADGIFHVFSAEGDKWSFAKADSTGKVTETAEKRRISDHASTGLYYFSRGEDFVRIAEDALKHEIKSGGEYYVAPLYNHLIGEGADIRMIESGEVWGLGTPDDLQYFLKNYQVSEASIGNN